MGQEEHRRPGTFWRSLPVIATVTLACAGSDPTSPPPIDVPGCYQLTLGPWSSDHESPDPPRSLTLLDSIGTRVLEEGRYLARPNPIDAPMPFLAASWDRPAADQLDLVFTGGYVGVHFEFEWTGDGWAGTGVAFTDVAPFEQATVRGVLASSVCLQSTSGS